MKPEVKKLWVEALTSGEYLQATHQLRRNTSQGKGYCCLGVLCDIYRKQTGNGEWNGNDFILRKEEATAFLPEAVIEWSGVEDRSPNTPIGRLSLLNDEGRDFKSIAKLIDKYL